LLIVPPHLIALDPAKESEKLSRRERAAISIRIQTHWQPRRARRERPSRELKADLDPRDLHCDSALR